MQISKIKIPGVQTPIDIKDTTYQFELDDNTLKIGTNGGTKTAVYTPDLDGYASRVYGATAGHLAGLNAGGDITDSGVAAEDAIKNAENITYAALKTKRDNSQLIPGRFYRITDYQCTTIQANTRSAGHQFDVIVRADSENVLNENAWAAKHAGDTYFANSKLEVWQLKYCLDNDTNRFYWATEGQFIKNLNSAFSNGDMLRRCPTFDNKNATGLYSEYQYAWGTDSDINDQDTLDFLYSKTPTINNGDTLYITPDGTLSQPAEVVNSSGVIYYMKDEFNNECPYDFKNIQFKRWAATVSEGYPLLSALDGTYCLSRLYDGSDCFDASVFSINDELDFVWRYTFHCYLENEDEDVDATLVTNNEGDSICIGNVIKEAHGYYDNDYYYKKIFLNDIVFYNYYEGDGSNVCFGNYIHYGCFNNTFLNSCYHNKLGGYNFFNIFGNKCYNNSFGNNCYNNSFGNYCYSITFGNECYNNSFGNYCYSNSFRNNCCNNIFGGNCDYNSFDNNCNRNILGNYCNNNSFGNNCKSIKFVKDYTWDIIIENGNIFIDITSNQTTSASSYLQNIKIAQGVNNTTTTKTISHNTVNDTFQTVYQPANSQVISV